MRITVIVATMVEMFAVDAEAAVAITERVWFGGARDHITSPRGPLRGVAEAGTIAVEAGVA